jgi:Ca2+-binding EF-hand superfamily protein
MGPSYKPFQDETYISKIVVKPGQGITQRSIIFNVIDTNQNGTVSLSEFLRFVRAYKLFR